MASTPSNRLKLTPSNSPFLQRLSRSPIRARLFNDVSSSPSHPSRLTLKRVVGSTCCSPTGFDTVNSSFAYIAGGAVVVVDVDGDHYTQRFYRARPAAVPVYTVSPVLHTPSTPNSTPKANDSRNRVAAGSHRDSSFGLPDWIESPTSGKTWTQRERIKSATCVSLSRNGRFLAVGETGYAPRVLIFGFDDTSSDTPLVSISEHSFGVTAIAWSADSRYLASLGTANDGFLYIWKVDPRTGAAKLFQQNRCTSYVRGMAWLGSSSLISFGVRHIKVWRVEEPPPSISPTKSKYASDSNSFMTPPSQQNQQQQHRTLPGRNILLGSLLEATFSCATPLADGRAIICSETGDICVLESDNKQMKLVRLRDVGFPISCMSVRKERVFIGGKSGQSLAVGLDELLLDCRRDSPVADAAAPSPMTPDRRRTTQSPPLQNGLVAMGFLDHHVVTVDSRRSIDIFTSVDHTPGTEAAAGVTRIPIPGHGEAIMGVLALPIPNGENAAFCTWSGSGGVLLWSVDGAVKASFDVPVEQVLPENELDPPTVNQLSVVRATKGAKLFVTADLLGVLRVFDFEKKKFILEIKAHASDCHSIAISEDDDKLLLASCGRDRMAQLFHRLPDGTIEHFQTLEFPAKVVQVLLTPDDKVITCSFDRTMQVHDLVSKPDELDAIAAIPGRVIALKASPSSMVLAPDAKSVYTSLLDRTICQHELATGRLMNLFKCVDEGGAETVILDALIYGRQAGGVAPTVGALEESAGNAYLLGLSNTDKSVRIYDAQTGTFLDREWGHTEAINGVALIDEAAESEQPAKDDAGASGCQKVVSVGSDGTIMMWSLDLRILTLLGSAARDPSPTKDVSLAAARPPLRRVLSKAELADFQRGSPLASPSLGGGGGGGGGGSSSSSGSNNGRRSPTRTISRKTSKYNLSSGGASGPARTPISMLLNGTASTINEDSASRRASAGSGEGSPPIPVSPKARVRRRPSLPAMGTTSTPTGGGGGGRAGGMTRKKSSVNNLRASYGFGSLSMATEQTCRHLRAYRKRLASTDPIAQDVLIELDQELRLTVAALGDRAIRSKAMSDELDGLLDEKLERLVSLLDEKWRLQHASKRESHQRPRRHHDRDDSAVSAASATSITSNGGSTASADRTGDADGRGRGSSNSTTTGNLSFDDDRERERPRTAGADLRRASAMGS